MVDHEFDIRLQRLFSAPGGLFEAEDARAFSARVEARVDRDWTVRRLAVGAAGLTGGSIAVVQLFSAGLLARIDMVSRATTSAAERGADAASGRLAVLAPVFHSLPFAAESLWLVAGMAVLAGALLATRLVDES